MRDARVFLDHIALYTRARADLADNLSAFAALGQQILSAKHESALSQWTFPSPAEIKVCVLWCMVLCCVALGCDVM